MTKSQAQFFKYQESNTSGRQRMIYGRHAHCGQQRDGRLKTHWGMRKRGARSCRWCQWTVMKSSINAQHDR